MLNLLLVEDSPTQLQAIVEALTHCEQRFNTTTATSLNEAKAILNQIRPDLAIIDLSLPDGKGTELLTGTGEEMAFPCIILTGEGNEEDAVEALKLGAIDYIVKSIINLNRIPKIVNNALRQWDALQEVRKSRQELAVREESYRNFTRQFRSLFNAIHDPILLLDPELTIVWSNRSADDLFAGEEGNLSGKLYQEIVEQKNVRTLENIATPTTPRSNETCRVRIGKHLYEQKAFPMLNDDANLANAVLIFRDITKETAIQEQKLHSGKLELLGELAAGVAHEINNPINGVINYADILSRSDFEPNRSKDICQRIIGEGERIAKIVRSLLNFAHSKGQRGSKTNINDVINEALLLSQMQLKKKSIYVETSYDEPLDEVTFDPQQLLQILLNLISNSNHALQKKYPESHPDKKICINCSQMPGYLQLSVEDFGTGVPDELLARLTEPFFTTKAVGEGTGLGLSICRQLVQENGGVLTIESQFGEFTKVIIDLPTLHS